MISCTFRLFPKGTVLLGDHCYQESLRFMLCTTILACGGAINLLFHMPGCLNNESQDPGLISLVKNVDKLHDESIQATSGYCT